MAPDDEQTGPVDQMLDLFIYAPLGFVLDARSLLPRFINRGRGQVTLARTLGQMAVKRGNNAAEEKLSNFFDSFSGGTPADVSVEDGASDVARSTVSQVETPGHEELPNDSATPDAGEGTRESEFRSESQPSADAVEVLEIASESLAIPDYDSLSASQVVPRLASLSTSELSSVRDYERTHRGRKTILNRVAQLQAD